MNNQYKYQCNICDYVTSRKSQYERHITTRKHIMTTNGLHLSTNNYTCECGKEYSCRQNLYRHKQKCDVLKEDKITSTPVESPPIDSALIVELLKQNKELHEMVIDLAKNNNTTNNTTNNTINNTTNNKFNLNVYLNETCKDAINLNDFIQSIELNINDFINTGEVGYVKGISSIMVDRIRDMEPNIRPIHSTDLKRETVYVKDSDKWAKEDENKTHLRKAVRIVADKNRSLVHPWREQNPNYEILDTPECDKFFEYTKASLGGYGKEEDLKFENKIINNILKETVIDKNLITN
ncbi:MAG: C2H2-type zinc finger protein [Minisyncoccia bacterium]